MAVEASGSILVIDAQAGIGGAGSGQGELVRINPQTGVRTSLTNFGAGPFQGSNPTSVAVEATGQILVTDEGHPSTTPLGLLYRIDPQTGARIILSDFNTGANTGREPEGVVLEAGGQILVVDKHAGPLTRGQLFRIDPQTGTRTILTDFGVGTNQGSDPLAVAVVPGHTTVDDTVAPTIVCDAAAGAWDATNVSIDCAASDDGSGLAHPTADAAFSLTTSVADGTEDGDAPTGHREVCDVAGNSAPAGPVGGNKIDRKAPTLILPPGPTNNAASPVGAIATFAVSASDGADPNPVVNCNPASGAVFGIGVTTVACNATDHVGNQNSGSFTVTVLGAKEQLSQLVNDVILASRLPAVIRTQLLANLPRLVATFNPSIPAQRNAACTALRVFTTTLRLLSGNGVSPAQARAGPPTPTGSEP